MAKSRRKKSGLSFKARMWLILLVIAAFAAGVISLLHFTGIMTVNEMLYKAGFKDKPAVSPDTQVHFIDVGQGDCTLVISKGEVMVIDSGDRDDSDSVVKYLKEQGVKKIKYLIATHPHADHIGEMPEIIGSFDVENFIMPKIPDEFVPATKTYEDMLAALKAKGIKATKAEDCELTLGECKLKLYKSNIENDSNLNNYSVLVKVVHGSNSFLITGDCEREEEQDILSRGCDIRAKVLKAGHHGSYTSSSAEFLDKVLPRYVVISCGRVNDYGHPNEETVDRLAKYADEIYVTAEVGTVVFESDGEGISVKYERQQE